MLIHAKGSKMQINREYAEKNVNWCLSRLIKLQDAQISAQPLVRMKAFLTNNQENKISTWMIFVVVQAAVPCLAMR